MNQKQPQNALKHFRAAAPRYRNSPLFFFLRGKAHFLVGQYQKSIDDQTTALLLHSKHKKSKFAFPHHALGFKARAEYHMGRYIRALVDLLKAIQLAPEDAELYFYKGQTHISMNDLNQAKRAFNQAMKLSEKHGNWPLYRSIQEALLKLSSAENDQPDAPKDR